MELAAGMFALALVVSALCGFAVYIVKSLEAQNELRRAGGTSEQYRHLEVERFASKYVFGTETFEIRERVKMPSLEIVK